MKRILSLLILALLFIGNIYAQQFSLKWFSQETSSSEKFIVCQPCATSILDEDQYLYFFSHLIPNVSAEQKSFQIINPIYKESTEISAHILLQLKRSKAIQEQKLEAQTVYDRGAPAVALRFPALKFNGSKIAYLVSFELFISDNTSLSKPPPVINSRPGVFRRNSWPSTSVLAEGTWYKIAVTQEGIYRIDKAFLDNLGINTSELNPKTIKIYGNHGDVLPELNSVPRAKDLQEMAIFVEGENDGRFDNNDFIAFYGRSPSKFNLDSASNSLVFSKNYYATETVYFLTFGGVNGKRMGLFPANANATAAFTPNSFDDVHRHERDLTNHIKSGKVWYGEHFDRILTHSISHTFPNKVSTEPVSLRTIMVIRSRDSSSLFLNLNGQSVSISRPGLFSLGYESIFIAQPTVSNFTFTPSSSVINLSVSYNKPSANSEAWIDFVEFRTKRNMIHSGSQTRFQCLESSVYPSTRYEIQGSSNMRFWDVTNPFDVAIQQAEFNANTHRFVVNNNQQVKLYYGTSAFLTPKPLGRQSNQNLHGVRDVDYIIVSHPDFLNAANQLADFHRQNSGLQTYVANINEVYNEFSSGIQDVSAVRDFVKMLWDEASSVANRPKYLLLFGDASYDYLNRLNNNTNFVPTYQSLNSHNPNSSFCTDDYFALLDDNEGNMNQENIGLLDIGVGRLTASTSSEASTLVAKIRAYHDPASLGNWRNSYTFVADDMDKSWESVFLFDSEQFAGFIKDRFPAANFNKIYTDAYEQQSLGGAQRYPQAVEDINKGIERGTLIWTFNGHGGQFGLASERIVEIPQINAWDNYNRLPVFMTATCELSRFDDPSMQSAGERILLNDKGGAIGLLTTTRLVFVTTNSMISRHFFQNALFGTLSDLPGERVLGEVYRVTKNRNNAGVGDRNFTYLGDPAIRLAVPQFKIVLDSLNHKSLLTGQVDTLKALSRVTFSGRVLNNDNSLKSDFNGLVYPTVFDKPTTLTTRLNDLANVDTSLRVLPFKSQTNILFNGRSQVKDGRFNFTFIVPKDINYRADSSRISMYADNGVIDAAGEERRIVIGGSIDSAAIDNQGPEIALFMNDFSFTNGGVTDPNPMFIATLFDENGINTTGAGIGRQLLATIDKGTGNERSIVLNEYYQASVDSYQGGEIRYRLGNIPEGEHTITLKAWDVHNNSSEATLIFVVESSKELSLKNVLNYPNPFSTRTTFHFDHNKPGQDLLVNLQIMTIGGRVVKQFYTEIPSADSHLVPFEWDARDEYGDKLGRGVYIYRVRAKTNDSEWFEKYEKLVILN